MFKVQVHRMILAVFVLVLAASTLPAQTATPLTAAPTSVAVTYQLPSTAGSAVTVHVTAAASTYFTVEQSSIPFWLTVGASNGTAGTTAFSLTFQASTLAGSLAAGSYNATVHLQVSGDADLQVPVDLTVAATAPTLSVSPSAETVNWPQGSAYPTYTLTLTSSGNPVDFTATPTATTTTNGSVANWVKVNHTSGVAYSFGTPLTISFVQAAFDDANVGDTLAGNIAIVSGGVTTNVVITITVTPPAATITSIFPAEAQVEGSSGTGITVVVTGSGFFNNTSAGTSTSVFLGSSSTALTSGVTIVNSTTMTVAIPQTSLASAGQLAITVQNGSGPTSAKNLNVTANPIVYSTTDSAGLVEAAPGTNPNVAPYEMVTLFGVGFLNGDTGTIQGTPDTTFYRYPNSLSDTDSGFTGTLTVNFYQSNGTTLIAAAYLLFASDTQINLLVPSGVAGNTTVKFSVTFVTGGSSSTTLTSSLYPATVVAANPGIFTTTSTGQGQGAILNSADYSANSSASKSAVGSTVLIYASGLGAPNSTATDVNSTTAAAYPAACVSLANYLAAVNAGTFTSGTKPGTAWTSLDGATILSTDLATNHFPPCMLNTGSSAVTVTIGGKAATVSYAGWVAGSVEGLYQINAVVPTGVTGVVPVMVYVGGTTVSSQSGVTMVTP